MVRNSRRTCNVRERTVRKYIEWNATVGVIFCQHLGPTSVPERAKSAVISWSWSNNLVDFLSLVGAKHGESS